MSGESLEQTKLSPEADRLAETAACPEAATAAADKTCPVDRLLARLAVDKWLDTVLGFITRHPWEKWLGVANRMVEKFMIPFIALSGAVTFLSAFASLIRRDAPISRVVAILWILIATVLVLALAPKAMALPRTFLEKSEKEKVRPELLSILKIVLGVGLMLYGLFMLLQFSSQTLGIGLACLAGGALLAVIFDNPGMIGVEAGYPQNGVEELVTIVMLPVRIVLSFLTLVVGIASVSLFVMGVIEMFSKGGVSSLYFGGAAIAPAAVPFAVYVAYLVLMFVIDFYRALVSIPRKLDDLHKAIDAK